MRSSRITSFPASFRCLLFFIVIAVAPGSYAQSPAFVFTKLVDTNDPVPGGNGTLFLPAEQPAFDGAFTVFRNGNNLAPDALWSFGAGGALKLLDLTAAVPGGTGNFSVITDIPVVRSGTVVFAGRDSATSGFTGGLYSIPAIGGAITRIANRNVAIPGGTGNFTGGFQQFSLDGTRVAFNGSGSVPGDGGIFAADVTGANLAALANGAHPTHTEFTFPVVNFVFPSISAGVVAFFGNNVFDPSTGYNALYTVSAAGGFAYSEPVTTNIPLPGDSTNPFHTRFGRPRLSGDNLFFPADDANTNPNFFGLYRMARSGGALTRIADVNSSLPGVAPISEFPYFAASGSQLAFTAIGPNSQFGLYVGDGVTTTKVVAAGDSGPFADSRGRVSRIDLGPYSFSGGQFVARIAASFSATGVYLVTPFAQSADVTATVSASPASPAIGATITLTLTVTNSGPASAQTPVARLTLPPGLAFLGASGGGTFDAVTRDVSFPLATLANGGNAAVTVSARVDLPGTLTAAGYATSATADSNRRNNHAYVSLPGPAPRASYYEIRTIADSRTSIPDRSGQTFGFQGGNGPLPATDGDRVVFVGTEAGAAALWSAKLDGTGGFTRLLTTGVDNVPGFPGDTFSGFASLRLRNGTAAFNGTTAIPARHGLFSKPAGGGDLAVIANTATPRPGGGAVFDFVQSFQLGQLGDGQITFLAQGGIYAFPVAGGGAGQAVVLPNSSIPITAGGASTFAEPSISGRRVVFDTTLNSVHSTFTDERRFETHVSPADISPSDPLNGTFANVGGGIVGPQVEGNTVVFRAYSGTGASIGGIYSVTGEGAPVKLVDTRTAVPGGTGNFSSVNQSYGILPFSFSGGEVVFIGTDAGTSRTGIYSVPAAGGAIRKIVAVGDVINGRSFIQNFTQPVIQTNALGQRQVVFQAGFFDFAANVGGTGVYAAVPVSRLVNLSTRLRVETGDNIGIAGFVITGGGNKRVLIRALGPSLAAFGVTNVLGNPSLEVKNSSAVTLQQNDNWRSTQQAEITATGFAPGNDLESALVATLGAGNYTALLSGGGGAGVSIVEVYDLDPVSDANSARLINVSTRGTVQTGENVMIGGFVLGGEEPRKVLVRALGPVLTSFGVPGALQNPTIQLFRGSTALAQNDDWRGTQQVEITASGFPPGDNRESAIVATLQPGAYTVTVGGVGATSGVGLVEIYELP